MERAPRRYVREGERVGAGAALSCGALEADGSGAACGGYLGGVPVGARLVFVSAPRELDGECERGAVSMRCARCGRQFVFTLRKAA